MTRRFAANVILIDESGNPQTFLASDVVPEWGFDQITNEAVFEPEADPADDAKPARKPAAKA